MNLQDEIETMKQQLAIMEAKLAEEKDKNKSLSWKPEVRDGYYFVDIDGISRSAAYTDSDSDKKILSHGNIFKTVEFAERASKLTRALLRQLSWLENNNDGWVVDWDNHDQKKSYTYYESSFKHSILWNQRNNNPTTVYMSKQNAEKLSKQLNDGDYTL